MNFADIFSGRTGGQGVQPALGNAGDGGKKAIVDNWLSFLTGAYETVTGAGTKNGPAPSPAAVTPAKTINWGIVVAVVAAVFAIVFVVRKT